eukprot:6188822-Pleurochrysis_carterae.AAC.4
MALSTLSSKEASRLHRLETPLDAATTVPDAATTVPDAPARNANRLKAQNVKGAPPLVKDHSHCASASGSAPSQTSHFPSLALFARICLVQYFCCA